MKVWISRSARQLQKIVSALTVVRLYWVRCSIASRKFTIFWKLRAHGFEIGLLVYYTKLQTAEERTIILSRCPLPHLRLHPFIGPLLYLSVWTVQIAVGLKAWESQCNRYNGACLNGLTASCVFKKQRLTAGSAQQVLCVKKKKKSPQVLCKNSPTTGSVRKQCYVLIW